MKLLRKLAAKTTNIILFASVVAILCDTNLEMLFVFITSLTISVIFTLTKKV